MERLRVTVQRIDSNGDQVASAHTETLWRSIEFARFPEDILREVANAAADRACRKWFKGRLRLVPKEGAAS